MAVLNSNVSIHIWKTLNALFITCNIVTMRGINYGGSRRSLAEPAYGTMNLLLRLRVSNLCKFSKLGYAEVR